MKLFLDTANLAEIEEAAGWGVLSGVTTNPTLVSREKGDFHQILKDISCLVDGPISAEVTGITAADMVKEGKLLAGIAPQIVIKIPITEEGLKATKELRREGIKSNITLVFSLNQALLAARVGAAFVSPFIGRLDDRGHDGMVLVKEIAQVFRYYALPTEIIAASIRHPLHVVEAARAGAHVATVPFKVLRQMVKHPLTDLGIQTFLKDWESKK
ncbi:MAG TPA: fructose-6-phosphate aldolase [Firmicutes bacterium]|nr:fructose-6-phosphate aldolase [Bacillota bacterium]